MASISPVINDKEEQPKSEQCEECGDWLHPKVAKYSWNAFGRPLCIKCQKVERFKRYPKKMAELLNKETN